MFYHVPFKKFTVVPHKSTVFLLAKKNKLLRIKCVRFKMESVRFEMENVRLKMESVRCYLESVLIKVEMT